jgi:hypothetical protein
VAIWETNCGVPAEAYTIEEVLDNDVEVIMPSEDSDLAQRSALQEEWPYHYP